MSAIWKLSDSLQPIVRRHFQIPSTPRRAPPSCLSLAARGQIARNKEKRLPERRRCHQIRARRTLELCA
jgi:hypothetical protein